MSINNNKNSHVKHSLDEMFSLLKLIYSRDFNGCLTIIVTGPLFLVLSQTFPPQLPRYKIHSRKCAHKLVSIFNNFIFFFPES